MRATAKAAGFTIIEMATVIIILGAVFLMTLKGRDFLQVVQAYMAGYQIQQYQARILAYEGEYRALPGDDINAPRRYGRDNAVFIKFGAVVTTAGDNKIDGALFDVTNPNGENFMVWRDLRYAGAVGGDPSLAGSSAMPPNPFGGVFGIDEGNLGQETASLCATRVPGRAAEIMDNRLDDGVINTGRVVATARYDVAVFNHFDEPDDAPYDYEKQYIICAPIFP